MTRSHAARTAKDGQPVHELMNIDHGNHRSIEIARMLRVLSSLKTQLHCLLTYLSNQIGVRCDVKRWPKTLIETGLQNQNTDDGLATACIHFDNKVPFTSPDGPRLEYIPLTRSEVFQMRCSLRESIKYFNRTL